MAVRIRAASTIPAAVNGILHIKNHHFKSATAVINGTSKVLTTTPNAGSEMTMSILAGQSINWSLTVNTNGFLDSYKNFSFSDWIYAELPGQPVAPLRALFGLVEGQEIDIRVDEAYSWSGYNVCADIVSKLGASRVQLDGPLLGCKSGSMSMTNVPDRYSISMSGYSQYFRVTFAPTTTEPLRGAFKGLMLARAGSYYRTLDSTGGRSNVLYIDTRGVSNIIDSFSNVAISELVVFPDEPGNFAFEDLITVDESASPGSFYNTFTGSTKLEFLHGRSVRFGKIIAMKHTNSFKNFINCGAVVLPDSVSTMNFRSVQTIAARVNPWTMLSSPSFEYVPPGSESLIYDDMVVSAATATGVYPITVGYSDGNRTWTAGQNWRIKRVHISGPESTGYTVPIEDSLSVEVWDGRDMTTYKGNHILPVTCAIIKASMINSTFSFIVDKHHWRQMCKHSNIRMFDIFKFSASEQGFVWTGVVSSTTKDDVTISGISLLDRVLDLPITYWDWITEPKPNEFTNAPEDSLKALHALQWWPDYADEENEKPKLLGPFIDAVVKYTYVNPLSRRPVQYFGQDPDDEKDETYYDIHIGSNDYSDHRVYPIQIVYSAEVGELEIEQSINDNPCDGSGNWLTSLCDLYGLLYTFTWSLIENRPTITVSITKVPDEIFLITDTTNGVIAIDQSVDCGEWETAQFYRLAWSGGFDEEPDDETEEKTRVEVMYEIDRYAYDKDLVIPGEMVSTPDPNNINNTIQAQNGSITGTLRKTKMHSISVDSNAKQFDPDWIVKVSQAARATGGDSGANNSIAIQFNSEAYHGLSTQLAIGSIVDVQSNELELIDIIPDLENPGKFKPITSLSRVISRTITIGAEAKYSVEFSPFDPFEAFFPPNYPFPALN